MEQWSPQLQSIHILAEAGYIPKKYAGVTSDSSKFKYLGQCGAEHFFAVDPVPTFDSTGVEFLIVSVDNVIERVSTFGRCDESRLPYIGGVK